MSHVPVDRLAVLLLMSSALTANQSHCFIVLCNRSRLLLVTYSQALFLLLICSVMATAVKFDVELIDPMYINAAIYEMNLKTERAMWALSKHISDL